jgi:retron-type reverse transcriptase
VVARRIRYAVEKHSLLLETQIGVRRGRLTETALYLLTEKVYIIWIENKPRVALILSLDIVNTFDRVSHTRLVYNLRKRKISEAIVR